MPEHRLAVVGLGKLGAPMAACLASAGFSVTAADNDPAKVDAINEGRAPVFERGLSEVLGDGRGALTATTSAARAATGAAVTFIVVPTPSGPDGSFSIDAVLAVCADVGWTLGDDSAYRLVVVTSTVMPGATGGPIRAALERASGRSCGTDFGLCYSPEFIALGSVIRDFLHPDFVLIGESDARAGDVLANVYHQVLPEDPPIARMSFVNAELAKLAVNAFITTKISFANTLARMCENLPGGDVDVVTNALGLDSRIGPKYLKGAVSYGGPCFPRDNIAFAALARSISAPADIALATDGVNRRQIKALADSVLEDLPRGGTVGILGLTYKAGTDVVDESTGLLLLRELEQRDIRCRAHDPVGVEEATRQLGAAAWRAASAEACIQASDAVVVATSWPDYAALPIEIWARDSSPRAVFDCWRSMGHLASTPGVSYRPIGIGPIGVTPATPNA
jgi:UDPglucose 6-dehydrogenase